jgi:chromosome segregation ATPase
MVDMQNVCNQATAELDALQAVADAAREVLAQHYRVSTAPRSYVITNVDARDNAVTALAAELNALRENYKASQKLLAIREEQIGEFLEDQKTLQAVANAAQRLLNAQAELALALEKLDGTMERMGRRVDRRGAAVGA